LKVDAIDVYFDDTAVFKEGRGIPGNIKKLQQIMGKDELCLRIRIAAGSKSFCLHTSDLTYDYVKINAHYHT
jgi:glutamate N-acetyltransferase/amino-acid N-acetyltransferase